MTEIGIEGFGAGHGKKHRAERQQADIAVGRDEAESIGGIKGREHARVVGDMRRALPRAITRNQTIITGPKYAATRAVPCD